MPADRLKLNTVNTEFILYGTRQQLVKVKRKSSTHDSVDISFSDSVTCLGVVLDNDWSRKVLLPSTPDAFCAPLAIRRRG